MATPRHSCLSTSRLPRSTRVKPSTPYCTFPGSCSVSCHVAGGGSGSPIYLRSCRYGSRARLITNTAKVNTMDKRTAELANKVDEYRKATDSLIELCEQNNLGGEARVRGYLIIHPRGALCPSDCWVGSP